MAEPILELRNLNASYGDFQALFGVEMAFLPGTVTAVIGANGAGKSTLLRSISGLLQNESQHVIFDGESIGAKAPHLIARQGIAMVPEGRQLFQSLSVEENLMLAADMKRPGPWTMEKVYALFPVLGERRKQPSTSLSGGQQQMVAIGRALLANPTFLMFDEISLGLAPIVIREIYRALPAIVGEGMTAVLVEQDISQALAVCDYVYCMQEGQVSLSGIPSDLSREEITRAYFGAT